MGNRGSKSVRVNDRLIVKEQRVDGIYRSNNILRLRCTLAGLKGVP